AEGPALHPGAASDPDLRQGERAQRPGRRPDGDDREMPGDARMHGWGQRSERVGHQELKRGMDDLDVVEAERVAARRRHCGQVGAALRAERADEVVEVAHALTSAGTGDVNCGMTSVAKSRRLA